MGLRKATANGFFPQENKTADAADAEDADMPVVVVAAFLQVAAAVAAGAVAAGTRGPPLGTSRRQRRSTQ